MDGILARGELDAYHLAHAARADLLARLGRREEAIEAYDRALGTGEAGAGDGGFWRGGWGRLQETVDWVR